MRVAFIAIKGEKNRHKGTKQNQNWRDIAKTHWKNPNLGKNRANAGTLPQFFQLIR